jgi:glutathionylspermidine synthase
VQLLSLKLYPWEWMFHDAFGARLTMAPTRWIEPPQKAILLINAGVTVVEQQGLYGAEGFIRQVFAPLPDFSGQYPVLGSRLVTTRPAACRFARTKIRSPAIRQGFCRAIL